VCRKQPPTPLSVHDSAEPASGNAASTNGLAELAQGGGGAGGGPLSVTGLIHLDRVLTNAGAKTGDALILTKPLGTGVLATAI
jgi:hypothetical protein